MDDHVLFRFVGYTAEAYDALQEGAKNVSREVCVGAKGCFVYKRLWLGWRYGPPFTSHWPCGPAMPCMRFSGFEMGFMCARREREKRLEQL